MSVDEVSDVDKLEAKRAYHREYQRRRRAALPGVKIRDREIAAKSREKHREKRNAESKEYYHVNKDEIKRKRVETADRDRAARHGITESELHQMEARYEGTCWVCRQPEPVPNRRLAIDHCHETGQVRGVLCSECNTALGLLDHDLTRIQAAFFYLKRYR